VAEEEPYEFKVLFAEPPEFFKLAYATETQETAIRSYATAHGFTDLRQFRAYMRERDWDYYDVLKERYR